MPKGVYEHQPHQVFQKGHPPTKGCFKKGHIPWSKLHPELMFSNSGSYKKGNISWSKLNPELMPRGKNHGMWKDGKYIKTQGYIYIRKPDHPFANQIGYVFEHRLIIEKWLREHDPNHPALIKVNGVKYLRLEWQVHHDGTRYPMGSFQDRQDNRIENLKLFRNNGEHTKYHAKLTKEKKQ